MVDTMCAEGLSHAMSRRKYSRTEVNIIAADAVIPCTTRPSVPVTLIKQDNQVLVLETYAYVLATFYGVWNS